MLAGLHNAGAFIPETVTSAALFTVSIPLTAMPLLLVISTFPVQVISALPETAGEVESAVTVTSVAPLTVRAPATAITPVLVMVTLPVQVMLAVLLIVGAFTPETVTSAALLTFNVPLTAMLPVLLIVALPVQVISTLPETAGAVESAVTITSVAPLTVNVP